MVINPMFLLCSGLDSRIPGVMGQPFFRSFLRAVLTPVWVAATIGLSTLNGRNTIGIKYTAPKYEGSGGSAICPAVDPRS